MSKERFPVGKLPAPVLADLLARLPREDPSVVVGPGVGLDCAVVETGDGLLVCKSDPITFVSDSLGEYLVQVNANDLATTGATPRWLLVTLLLPQAQADRELVDSIMGQIEQACRGIEATLIGGHTEITHGIDRPIAMACLLGQVARDKLITPRGAHPGDRVLITKSVPIEGTAIIASELAGRLRGEFDAEDLASAKAFLWQPGISVVRDARVALAAGRVTAMHDPTEGGVLAALWELAQACGHTLRVDPEAIPVPEISARLCNALGIDPLATIASGALLITAAPEDSDAIRSALEAESIPCADIGEVRLGTPQLERAGASGIEALAVPPRDEIARLFEDD